MCVIDPTHNSVGQGDTTETDPHDYVEMAAVPLNRETRSSVGKGEKIDDKFEYEDMSDMTANCAYHLVAAKRNGDEPKSPTPRYVNSGR